MMKKGLIFGTLLLLSAYSHAGMTICNKYSCQPARAYDSQEILNALAQTFFGEQKELVFCEANEQDKTCENRPITFMGQTNLMSVQFQIPFVRILQLSVTDDALQLLLDYQLQANQYYPTCSSVNSTLTFSVSNQGDFLLTTPDFNCRVTELGNTTLGLRFTLDYLDLDKGVIGAKYQSTAKGDVLGGGTGYTLMKLSKLRSIEMPRPLPTEFVSEDGYRMNAQGQVHGRRVLGNGLVDWDLDNIKVKWNSFKEKFLKILYLEPLE